MAQMLGVTAGQDCHPVAVFVLTEIKQMRAVPSVSAGFAFPRGDG